MLTYTYRYKIKPTQQQVRQFEQYLSICRSVYNYALAERKAYLESRKCRVDCCSIASEYIIPADAAYPSYHNQATALTIAKNQFPHLKLVNAQVLQQVLKRLDKAWSDFFNMPSRGFPRFRGHNRFRSFVFPQPGKNCLDKGRVKLPSIGWVRIRQSRDYPTGFTAKRFQVVKKASGYYLLITFQSVESVPEIMPGKVSIALDAGIGSFIHTSRNQSIKAPLFLKQSLMKLRMLQRRLKNKTKGSRNWLKAVKRISQLHERIANARRDWHFKLAHYICDQTDNIFVEDINFNSWSRGLFRKQSLDSGIGSFINEILPFVAWKRGKYYLKIDKNYSSQECPSCRLFTGKKTLSERVHKCQYCGAEMPRDLASCFVLEQRGRRAVGQPVNTEIACGDDATGVLQLTLFDLVGNL